ncbi:MAG TPA: EAL domain-containing protein [Steroidobacteraceae bacterium]|nr:EAL domain-containing protein [Steroidobacteraceae bacterium]
MQKRQAPLLKSRIGRRVVGLFILSALVPLCLCTGFLIEQFDAQIISTSRHNLDDLVRSFGISLLARLGSADDVLKVIVSAPRATDDSIEDSVAKLLWVRSVRRVAPRSAELARDQALPRPDARQLLALKMARSVVVSQLGESGNPQIFVVRTLPSGAWLYTEISSTWLWSDARDFATDAGLIVSDGNGLTLDSAGKVPVNFRNAAALPHGWTSRSWEIFLGSRFSSPSWRVAAISPQASLLAYNNGSYLYLIAFALLTILLIAWLSMTVIRRQLHPLDLLTKATKRVAQRDFESFDNMSWNDEFGDLARSFQEMTGKLKVQFSALEMLSEVDRLLLHAPALESILGTLLPRMAALLHCDCVSVLLFDPDSDGHARAYDYDASEAQPRPIRRIAAEVAALKAECERTSPAPIGAAAAARLAYFAPSAAAGVNTARIYKLEHNDHCTGALCVGYAGDVVGPPDSGVSAADLADRLSVILANLKQSESLHRQANYDLLTGLQNRHSFSDRARSAVAAAQEHGLLGALLYLDLDQFKRVNDTAGHSAGDGLLRIVAERLAECIGDVRRIARLAGDEFAILLPSIPGPDSARQVAERIIVSLQRPIVVDGREHHVSASIGMTVFPSDGTQLEELLRASDIAMYQAKDAGRGRAMFFQAEMQRNLEDRLKLETGMHRALQNHHFTLHFQPIVSETDDGCLGVEALVRWPNRDHSPWVSPAVFVPIAEENGFIVPLGDWILRSACGQFARWRAEGVKLHYISVNASVRQLREPGFPASLMSALRDSGMRGEELQIEITESVLAHGAELQRTLIEISAMGVRLALDDFGTGYSSLSYIRTFPIDVVKIDRSFVMELPHDQAACRLTESIIVMCAALGKKVVAEGVETEAQRRFLRQVGCTTIQGYLVGRPMEAADIPGFARRLRSMAPATGDDDGVPAPQSVARSA